VLSCRNFLIEADVGTIEDQQKALIASGLPFSTMLLSGGKSLHAIIALEEPVDPAQYREIHKRLCLFIPSADPMTCDPSRFSRFPNAYRIREDGGSHEQAIIDIGTRIANKPLMDKLFSFNANYMYESKYPVKPAYQPRNETNLIPSGDMRIVRLVATLDQKYPLTHGVKNRNLSCWTTALCANTSLTDEEISGILATHDKGDNCKVSEYEYAIQTARRRLGTT
jgi:hypothetical protein